ncbi:MAG: hypothetical protein E7606_03780 [Ruminococcaceae bacterium]|nr:hypothetical protein [Oscillospiraceae bacterium]
MLAYKLCGVGLLLLCGVAYPRLCARDRRAALLQIEALLTLVGFVRRQIALYRLPVREILLRCDGALLSQFGGREESLRTLFAKTRWLDGEAERIALSFAEALGKGFVGEELGVCDGTQEELAALRDKKRKEEGARRKTEGTLSLGVAALAVILLV